jgi:hypothetical protein
LHGALGATVYSMMDDKMEEYRHIIKSGVKRSINLPRYVVDILNAPVVKIASVYCPLHKGWHVLLLKPGEEIPKICEVTKK